MKPSRRSTTVQNPRRVLWSAHCRGSWGRRPYNAKLRRSVAAERVTNLAVRPSHAHVMTISRVPPDVARSDGLCLSCARVHPVTGVGGRPGRDAITTTTTTMRQRHRHRRWGSWHRGQRQRQQHQQRRRPLHRTTIVVPRARTDYDRDTFAARLLYVCTRVGRTFAHVGNIAPRRRRRRCVCVCGAYRWFFFCAPPRAIRIRRQQLPSVHDVTTTTTVIITIIIIILHLRYSADRARVRHIFIFHACKFLHSVRNSY